MSIELVNQTWDEIGRKVRALRYTVFLRTEPVQTQSLGGIHYPASTTGFYDGLMHMRLVCATVLAVGNEVHELEPGMRVCFQRKYLARWQTLKDGTFVGWIHSEEVTGILEEGAHMDKYLDFTEGPKAIRAQPV